MVKAQSFRCRRRAARPSHRIDRERRKRCSVSRSSHSHPKAASTSLTIERDTLQKSNNNKHIIKDYRTRQILGLGIAGLALLGFATAPAALAQNYTITTLVTFNGVNGRGPAAGLTLSGSTLYGTTYGEVLMVPTQVVTERCFQFR
jgi:hypothetical protein